MRTMKKNCFQIKPNRLIALYLEIAFPTFLVLKEKHSKKMNKW